MKHMLLLSDTNVSSKLQNTLKESLFQRFHCTSSNRTNGSGNIRDTCNTSI